MTLHELSNIADTHTIMNRNAGQARCWTEQGECGDPGMN